MATLIRRRVVTRTTLLILFSSICFALGACGYKNVFTAFTPAESVEGVVVDQNGDPIPSAYVVQQYNVSVSQWPHYVGTKDECYWSEVVKTDQVGRFVFPPNEKYSRPSHRDHAQYLMAFQIGFRSGELEGDASPPVRKKQTIQGENVIVLQSDTGPVPERLRYLNALFYPGGGGLFSCFYFDPHYDGSHVEVMKAIYEEARGIARTEDDKRIVEKTCEVAMRYYDGLSRSLFRDLFPEPCVFDAEHFNKLRERHRERDELVRREREGR